MVVSKSENLNPQSTRARLSGPRLLFASLAGLVALYVAWGLYRVLS